MVKKAKYKIANIELSKIVSLLGKILGIVVKEQEGTVLYNKIEQIRSLSKASRGTKNKKKIKLNETKKFRQLISTINKLKPNCILINTSRGEIIDEEALCNALKEKKIFGAGLDVYNQ